VARADAASRRRDQGGRDREKLVLDLQHETTRQVRNLQQVVHKVSNKKRRHGHDAICYEADGVMLSQERCPDTSARMFRHPQAYLDEVEIISSQAKSTAAELIKELRVTRLLAVRAWRHPPPTCISTGVMGSLIIPLYACVCASAS
jgi:hypothetical protein